MSSYSPSAPAPAHVRGATSSSSSRRHGHHEVKQARPARRKRGEREGMWLAAKACLRILSVTSAVVIFGLEIAIELLPIVVHDQIAAAFIFLTCCAAVLWDTVVSFTPRSWRAYRIKPKTHVVAEILVCILAWVAIAYIYGQSNPYDLELSDPGTRGSNSIYSKTLVAFMSFLSFIHLIFFGSAILDKRKAARRNVIYLPPMHTDPELSRPFTPQPRHSALQEPSSESVTGGDGGAWTPAREWPRQRDSGPHSHHTARSAATSPRYSGEMRQVMRGEAQTRRVGSPGGRSTGDASVPGRRSGQHGIRDPGHSHTHAGSRIVGDPNLAV